MFCATNIYERSIRGTLHEKVGKFAYLPSSQATAESQPEGCTSTSSSPFPSSVLPGLAGLYLVLCVGRWAVGESLVQAPCALPVDRPVCALVEGVGAGSLGVQYKVTVKVGGRGRLHELPVEAGHSVGRESGE